MRGWGGGGQPAGTALSIDRTGQCCKAALATGFAPVQMTGSPPLGQTRSLVSSCQENDEAPAVSGAKPWELHWAILGSRLCPARRNAMVAQNFVLWKGYGHVHRLPGLALTPTVMRKEHRAAVVRSSHPH